MYWPNLSVVADGDQFFSSSHSDMNFFHFLLWVGRIFKKELPLFNTVLIEMIQFQVGKYIVHFHGEILARTSQWFLLSDQHYNLRQPKSGRDRFLKVTPAVVRRIGSWCSNVTVARPNPPTAR